MAILAIKVKSGHIIKCPVHGWHIIPDRWQCNGTSECPDFKPSVREFESNPEMNTNRTRCHYTINQGHIQFHGDNPHDKNGQTLPMEAFTEAEIAHYNTPGYQE